MRLDELQKEVMALTAGIEHPRVGAALALSEECGELMRCVLDREYYGKENRELLVGEVGDVLIALAEVCDRYGISLETAAKGAVAKLKRKAPEWRAEIGDRLKVLRARMDVP